MGGRRCGMSRLSAKCQLVTRLFWSSLLTFGLTACAGANREQERAATANTLRALERMLSEYSRDWEVQRSEEEAKRSIATWEHPVDSTNARPGEGHSSRTPAPVSSVTSPLTESAYLLRRSIEFYTNGDVEKAKRDLVSARAVLEYASCCGSKQVHQRKELADAVSALERVYAVPALKRTAEAEQGR